MFPNTGLMIAEVHWSINEDKKGQTTRALKNFPASQKHIGRENFQGFSKKETRNF